MILGAGWVGLGLGHLLLIRDLPSYGRLAITTVLLTVEETLARAWEAGRIREGDLVLRQGRDGETYNVGSGVEASIEEIVREVYGR